MSQIPRIIHQIWSGENKPLPEHYRIMGETWKRDYPAWKYELWDNARIILFIEENYPQFKEAYNGFLYNVQRWDVIRYLILKKIGGIYADFDYESLKPMNGLLRKHTCCFATEEEITDSKGIVHYYFNNAFIASIPNHLFIERILRVVFNDEYVKKFNDQTKFDCVLNTTGPRMLYKLYRQIPEEERKNIFLIPTKDVSPLTYEQACLLRKGQQVDEIMEGTKNAYAIHYFMGEWISDSFQC